MSYSSKRFGIPDRATALNGFILSYRCLLRNSGIPDVNSQQVVLELVFLKLFLPKLFYIPLPPIKQLPKLLIPRFEVKLL